MNNTVTTTYTFAPDAGQCANPVTLGIIVSPLPEFGIQGGCVGTAFVLNITPISNFDADTATYVWTDSAGVPVGGNSPSITVASAGTYNCTITTGGCSSASAMPFTANSISCGIQKGISPNGDGKNDSFELTGLIVRHLSIYNRYGTKVYSLDNYSNEWHGQSNKGNELPDATYYFVIERDNIDAITGWIYINRQY